MPYINPEKEKVRQEIRRKTPEYKAYQKEYQRKWRKENPEKMKLIREKSEARPERKAYVKLWQKTSPKAKAIRQKFSQNPRKKEYDKQWNKNNPDKVKAKYTKYYKTIKGVVNYLKKKDKKKFGTINNEITSELIKMVNERDTLCVYCLTDLLKTKIEYDHLDAFLPFSNINIVRCCKKCNRSKSNGDVLKWCKRKGYTPAPIVYELLKKQEEVSK